MLEKNPEQIALCNLEVIVMPNGEILCLGKSIGFIKTLGKYLTIKEEIK